MSEVATMVQDLQEHVKTKGRLSKQQIRGIFHWVTSSQRAVASSTYHDFTTEDCFGRFAYLHDQHRRQSLG